MTIFNVFTLMGGIAMFLYGMDLMGKALEQTAGSKLQGILSTMTSSPIRALLLGVAVTAVIQSSGATTVMAVGFVNSGLMELHQAIGVIMGANIGTTVTGWLLSLSGLEGESFITKMLNPNAWSPILGFIGIWLYMVGKDRKRGVGKILLGFAILMAGMNTMSNAMSPLADEPWFMNLFLSFSNPVLGVIAGAVLTAVLQSSSAAVGILQALTSTGAVTYSAAVPIIMGQNIGTTVTALISSAGANKNAKRTAFVHLYFNVIGTIIFLCGFYGLHALIRFSFFNATANTFGIAMVHTIFNIVTTAILLPFNRLLEKLAIMTVPDSPADKKQENSLLDDRLLATPSVAVARAMLTGGENIRLIYAVPIVLLAGALMGAINGFGIAYVGIAPVIMTMASNIIYQGLLVGFTGGTPGGSIPQVIKDLAVGDIGGISTLFLLWMLVSAAAWILLVKTPYGRKLYGVGTSEQVSLFSGVSVKKIKLSAYAFCGMMAALAGMLYSGKLSQLYLGMGDTYQMASVSAVAIGGISLVGGSGSYIGAIAGSFVIIILDGLLAAMSLSQGVQKIIYGIVLFLAVLISSRKKTTR
mgnify:FL=1